jgi:hypothetical protein
MSFSVIVRAQIKGEYYAICISAFSNFGIF